MDDGFAGSSGLAWLGGVFFGQPDLQCDSCNAG
jgi:hypothetical protein